MDNEREQALNSIKDQLLDVRDQIDKALDEYAQHQFKLETRARVDSLARRYRDLVRELPEMQRLTWDRNLGRKIVDLQQLAAPLPAPPEGTVIEERAKDEFWETRAPSSSRAPVQIASPSRAPQRGLRISGDVKSWCSKCNGMTTHTITAMTGGQPMKVRCGDCKAEHKYRAEAPRTRRKSSSSSARRSVPARSGARDKKEKELQELIQALQSAETIRPYRMTDRYKTGDFIDHPEFGRGRVENALPRSILVHFTTGRKLLKHS